MSAEAFYINSDQITYWTNWLRSMAYSSDSDISMEQIQS